MSDLKNPLSPAHVIFNHRTHPLYFDGLTITTPLAFWISRALKEHPSNPLLIIVPDEEAMQHLRQALLFFNPNQTIVLLPEWDVLPGSHLSPSVSLLHQRLTFFTTALFKPQSTIFLATWSGLLQLTCPVKIFRDCCISVTIGSRIETSLKEHLKRIGYQEAPIVERIGQMNWRGHLIDIATPSLTRPIRIELFGNEVVSMRIIDIESQTSADETINAALITPCSEVINPDEISDHTLRQIRLLPATFFSLSQHEILSFLQRKVPFPEGHFLAGLMHQTPASAFDYLPSDIDICFFHRSRSDQELQKIFSSIDRENGDYKMFFLTPSQAPLEFFAPPIYFESVLPQVSFNELEHHRVWVSEIKSLFSFPLSFADVKSERWRYELQSRFNGWLNNHFSIIIFGKSELILSRLAMLLSPIFESVTRIPQNAIMETIPNSKIYLVLGELPHSFVLNIEKLVFLSDHLILGKKTSNYQSTSVQAAQEIANKTKIFSFSELTPGDLLVHKVHGIGVFEELKYLSLHGYTEEFFQIRYKDNDRLYLPVTKINLIEKYSGPSDFVTLDKLGSSSWQKTKDKVSARLKDMAAELITIYAQRSMTKRAPYILENSAIEAFSDEFPYSETPDQLKAIEQIYQDLQSSRPMDRLICGDVGFGKTEVAMRAAFAVASNGKQVALICPTTILSYQHFENFKRRFKNFPVTIVRLDRFLSSDELRNNLQMIRDGSAHIIIGTHRLLSSDVQFKNLGLLIIDEEQKFGVKHKEKFKKLKTNIDILTMSATPIPRTLNLSLLGIRDISLISTAPDNRHPIRTFLIKWDSSLIVRAVQQELERGGQVLFVHNRIEDLPELTNRLRNILPSHVRIKMAHGRFDEMELEQVMYDFFNHRFDVLVSTAIIESGMDNPRANTLFIHAPHLLGLSQIYQIRGRVGRSQQRAYCYLIMPEPHHLTPIVEEKLKVIQEHTALGSGLKIAQYDLELRGAGSILGEDQSGHIAAVGYEMYMDLLKQAIESIKNQPLSNKIDCEVNLRIPAFIPSEFMPDIRIRLSYYKAISLVQNEDDTHRIQKEISDRFGPLPEVVTNLLGISLIRNVAEDLGAYELNQGSKNIILTLMDHPPLSPQLAIQLASSPNKKYQILPPNRFSIRINEVTWQRVYEELLDLRRLVEKNAFNGQPKDMK
ncbi:MAG: transcription-repair coupling factor [Bdellovibrionaceae bacterium]|nr:transcription-repair coupling factor [Pseudobdellovibrionaceae bacterium]